MTRKKALVGNLFLLTAAVAWGLAFTAQKVAAMHLPPFLINGARFLVGGIVLIPVVLILDRTTRSDRRLIRLTRHHPLDITRAELIGGLSCGTILFLASTLQQISLSGEHVGPGKASFLTALYVVFVPFYGLIRRKIAAPHVWVSVAIAIGGAYLLTNGGIGGLALGGYDIILLASAAFFALHIVVIDIFVPHVDAVRMSMIQFLVAGVLGIPFMIFLDPHIAPAPTGADLLAALPAMLYLGVISSGVGYTVQVIGQKLSAAPTVASLIMSLESVIGLFGGVILLDETLSGYQLGGCAVIFFAVVLSQLPIGEWVARLRQKRAAPEKDENQNEQS